MSNSYFKMDCYQEVSHPKEWSPTYPDYDVSGTLSLCAFMGKEHRIQITIQQRSGASEHDRGTAYLTLTNEEAERLAKALMERVNGDISATGIEKSKYTDEDDDD